MDAYKVIGLDEITQNAARRFQDQGVWDSRTERTHKRPLESLSGSEYDT